MRLVASGLLVAAALFLGGANLIDEGELHCEEAVNHLSDCCHGSIADHYSCEAGRGCDDHRPDLDDPLATQIRGESCAELVASGTCENPAKSPQPPPPVCGSSLFEPPCDDAAVHDLAVDDLAPPADLSTVDGAAGDGP